MVERKKPARPKPDVFDACAVLGYGAVVTGIWYLSPPAALIVGGLGLLVFGVLGSWRKGKEAD